MNGKANYGVNYAPTIATDDTKFDILLIRDDAIMKNFAPDKCMPCKFGKKRPRDDDCVESMVNTNYRVMMM